MNITQASREARKIAQQDPKRSAIMFRNAKIFGVAFDEGLGSFRLITYRHSLDADDLVASDWKVREWR